MVIANTRPPPPIGRTLCAEVSNMRNLRELTLEGNDGLAELPDLSFFPSLQVLRVPTTKRYPIPKCVGLVLFASSWRLSPHSYPSLFRGGLRSRAGM
jgi:hypothetical protein